MLCNINGSGNFFLTWGVLTLLGLASQMIMSGLVFLKFYSEFSIATFFFLLEKKCTVAYP